MNSLHLPKEVQTSLYNECKHVDTAELSEAEHMYPEVQVLKAEGPHTAHDLTQHCSQQPSHSTKWWQGVEEHVGPRVLPTCAAVIIPSHFVQPLFSSRTDWAHRKRHNVCSNETR